MFWPRLICPYIVYSPSLQIDWADHPARWIQLLKMHIDQQWSMPQNSQKTSESYKTREMLLTKLVSDYFFGRFSENWKTNRKHWANDS